MNILIAGCGYIGLPLGINLKSRGHEVTGWVFSETSGQKVSSSGLQVIVDDLRSPQSWARYQQQFDAIFYCPSTRGGSPEDYQQIYVDGMKQSIGALKPGGTFFYTGSTSVFSQTDGSLVDESSPTEPGSGNGSILLQAEQVALSAGGLVLRLVPSMAKAEVSCSGVIWRPPGLCREIRIVTSIRFTATMPFLLPSSSWNIIRSARKFSMSATIAQPHIATSLLGLHRP